MVKVTHPSHPKKFWFIVKWFFGIVIYIIDIQAIKTIRRTVAVSKKILTRCRCSGKEFIKTFFRLGKCWEGKSSNQWSRLLRGGRCKTSGAPDQRYQMLSAPWSKGEKPITLSTVMVGKKLFRELPSKMSEGIFLVPLSCRPFPSPAGSRPTFVWMKITAARDRLERKCVKNWARRDATNFRN